MDPKTEGYIEMMRLWSDTAKGVKQLATASFLISIIFGTTYQLTAARPIGDAYSNTATRRPYPNQQFWALSASLALGLALFVGAFVSAR